MEPTAKLRQAIRDYKGGNPQAFDTLYRESSKYVYACIYKVMSGNDNVQDAMNDVMQDTYVEISKYITQLKDEEKFLSWAGTIATRKALAYLKKNENYVLLNEEDTTFDTLADNDNIIPESIMQDREKQRLLREIIDKELTEMQKLCIIAFYYNQQKQSEIAQELGIPENTVKTNLSRAKAKIKEGVLDLEKNKGTRLYSVAPFMLLLFKEEIRAAVVPQEITKNVLAAVAGTGTAGAAAATGVAGTGAGTAGTGTAGAGTASAGAAGVGATGTVGAGTAAAGAKGVAATVASVSIKAKIIGVLVGLGVLGGIGGAVFMANRMKADNSWEKVYKACLLNYEQAEEFDLNDFDEDGIPELVIKTESTFTEIYYMEDQELKLAGSIQGQMYSNLPDRVENWDDCRLGYGMNYDELIKLDYGKGVYNETGEEYNVKGYAFYRYVDGEILNESSDGMDVLEQQYNEILFSEIEEEKIDERFEEFKKSGNRPRALNTNIKNDMPEPEENVLENEDISSEQEEVEEVVEEEITEVEVSAEEQENFRILAQFLTATRWGEDLNGQEIVPDQQNVCDFIGRVANENFEYNQWAYDKYLPTRIAEEEFRQVYTADSIKTYAKSVFGIELSEINSHWLYEENGNYATMEAQYSSGDKCELTKVVKDGDTYIVTGNNTFGSFEGVEGPEPEYMETYGFTMTLVANSESPFGYTVQSIKYGQGDAQEAEDEDSNALQKLLLHPENHSEYYTAISDYQNLCFAPVDIDGDGIDEVLLAQAYSIHPDFGPEAMTIINILKYDPASDVVTDFDGDKIYEPLSNTFCFKMYDTGILMTRSDLGYAYTNFWNLMTGEFLEGWLWYPNDIMAGVESEGHSVVKKQDGTEVTGEEGDAMYKSLTSGKELELKWYETTKENVKNIFN